MPTKVHLVKAMVFPVVMYGYESWTVRKAEHRKIDAFELWCWRRLLRVCWTARRSNQSILKDISPGCSLEGLMLRLKLQYFGHLLRRVDSLEKTHLGKCWEGLGAGGEGDDRGRDGWMASPTRWTWVWVNSGSLWWTGRPGVLQFIGSAKSWTRLSDWTELNWKPKEKRYQKRIPKCMETKECDGTQRHDSTGLKNGLQDWFSGGKTLLCAFYLVFFPHECTFFLPCAAPQRGTLLSKGVHIEHVTAEVPPLPDSQGRGHLAQSSHAPIWGMNCGWGGLSLSTKFHISALKWWVWLPKTLRYFPWKVL